MVKTSSLYFHKARALRHMSALLRYNHAVYVIGTSARNLRLKNLFILSVRISSYGCTQEVWRAQKMRKSSSRRSSNSSFLSALQTSQVHPQLDIRTARSMSKFIYNRVTTRICAKKPFIAIETKILTTHKKK